MEASRSVSQVPKAQTAPHAGGMLMLIVLVLATLLSVAVFVLGVACLASASGVLGTALLIAGILGMVVFPICFAGLKVLAPNQAYVFTLFGRYYGTLSQPGFYFVHPFCIANAPAVMHGEITGPVQKKDPVTGMQTTVSPGKPKRISLKTRTLDNRTQKVNDAMGNPIVIGTVVIWRVADPTAAVFAVENF